MRGHLKAKIVILNRFFALNDYACLYEIWKRESFIPSAPKRNRQGKLSLGEMLFIMVLFHLSA